MWYLCVFVTLLLDLSFIKAKPMSGLVPVPVRCVTTVVNPNIQRAGCIPGPLVPNPQYVTPINPYPVMIPKPPDTDKIKPKRDNDEPANGPEIPKSDPKPCPPARPYGMPRDLLTQLFGVPGSLVDTLLKGEITV